MYKKIVLKLSGEALASESGFGIDFNKALDIAKSLKIVYDKGIRLLLVIGGGNFWRGRSNQYMESETSDYVGMLGTEMNALVLGDALRQAGCPYKVFLRYSVPCSLEYDPIELEKSIDDNILIVGGGIGKPGYSTDSGASRAAIDIKADLLLKMSKTDGIYDKDPFKYPDSKKMEHLSYDYAIENELGIMDLQAFIMCKEASIPIMVAKMDNLLDIIPISECQKRGSLIEKDI